MHASGLAVNTWTCDDPIRMRELIEWGTPFDRENGKIAFTLEGGHSHNRIIHADGDATGRAIEVSMIGKLRNHPNITILENNFCVDLLHKNGVCYGLNAKRNF